MIKQQNILFLLLSLFVTVKPAAGDLDTSFNPGGTVPGTVQTTISNPITAAYSVAIQADSKIVVVGQTNTGDFITPVDQFALVRYNTDASLDTTFNGTGIVTTNILGNSVARSVKIQSDGKIVVAGYSGAQIAIARYNTNGSLDTTFNPTGVGSGIPGVTVTSIGIQARANSLAIQADGKLVVAGFGFPGSDVNIAVVRYNTDGSLDSSFNGTGIVTTSIGTVSNATSVAIQADGKIVVGGNSGFKNQFTVVRYNTDGTIDAATFNPTGSGSGVPGAVVTTINNIASSEFLNGIAIQADGKIVTSGTSTAGSANQFASTRYNTDGSLDTGYNGTGKLLITFPQGSSTATSIAIQADQKILLGGSVDEAPSTRFALARVNTDGTLDSTFGSSGLVVTALSGFSNASINGIAIQPDSRIVVAGSFQSGITYNFAAARYLPVDVNISITSPANNSTITTNQPVITGTGNPNTQVNVVIRNSSNVIVFSGSVVSNSSGNWSLPIAPTTLTNGNYTVTATLLGVSTTNSFTVNAPNIAIASPANNSIVTTNQPTITGTANPNAQVSIVIRNSSNVIVFSGSTVANSSGSWSLPIAPATLPNGRYTVTATVSGASITNSFTVNFAGQCIANIDLLTQAIRNKYGQ